MKANLKLKSTMWLDAVFTIILYFTGQRAYEWVTKIRLKHVIFGTVDDKDWDGNRVVTNYIKISPEWRTKCTSEKTMNSWGAIMKVHGLSSTEIQPYDILTVCRVKKRNC